jgi:hypothetical protein
MATYNGISAISQSLLNVLREASPPAEFGSPSYDLVQPDGLDGATIPSFTLLLWRVSVSGARRNQPPRRFPDGRTFRPSLPLDLHYLLTPWASSADTQQRMLGWAMRVYEDMTVLPAAVLNYNLHEPDTFAPNEAVELFCDPLALVDLFSLWDKLKPKLQTSMTYQVRGVMIDSQVAVPDAAPVQVREFQMAGATP